MRAYHTTTALCLTLYGLASAPALALPQGGQVAAGNAQIGTASAQQLQVNQQSQRAVIDWQSFNIGAGEQVNISQPNANAVLLNRVSQTNPSQIHGQLSANGNVWLVNPGGVVFGDNATVDVGGLIATTADIDNHDFMQGQDRFGIAGNPNAGIVNQGRITADGGTVALLGAHVSNQGTIRANLGKITLAATDTFTVDFHGDGMINFVLDDIEQGQNNSENYQVQNSGHLIAHAGQIELSVAQGNALVNRTLDNQWGIVQANSIGTNAAGQIVLGGGATTTTSISGTLEAKATTSSAHGGRIRATGKQVNLAADTTLDVSGAKAGSIEVGGSAQATTTISATLNATSTATHEQGGSITVTGDRVALLNDARLDASGAAGGGVVHVGGEYQGGGETHTAQRTFVGANTSIIANATQQGDGGEVIVWADESTYFYGSIEATAALADGSTPPSSPTPPPYHGNGGFVEVSGRRFLDYGGVVSLQGNLLGTLLLDPDTINIDAGTANPVEYADNQILFAENSPGTTTLGATTLANTLTAGTNVVLQANNNINVNSAVTSTGTGDLTLTTGTGGTVNVGAALDVNSGNLTIQADEIDISANITSTGDVTLTTADATTAIQLGSTATAGALNLTDAELDFIQSGADTVTLGADAHTAGIDLDGAISTLAYTNLELKSQGDITLNADLDATNITGYVWLDTSESDADYNNGDIVDGGGTISLNGASLLLTASGVGTSTDPISAAGVTNLAGRLRNGGFFLDNSTIASDIIVSNFNGVSGISARSGANLDDGLRITNDVGGITIDRAISLTHDFTFASLRANGLLEINNSVEAGSVTLNGNSFDFNAAINPEVVGSGNLNIQTYDQTQTLGIGSNTSVIAGVNAVIDDNSLLQLGDFDAIDFGGIANAIGTGQTSNLYFDVGAHSFSSSVELSTLGAANSIFINGDVVLTGAGDSFTTETHNFFDSALVFNNGATVTTNNGDILIQDRFSGVTFNGNAQFNAGSGTFTLEDLSTNSVGSTVSLGANNLEIYADEIDIAHAITTTGNVTLSAGQASTAIQLGSTATAGALNLTDAELDFIQAGAGTVTIGDFANTGGIDVDGALSTQAYTNLVLTTIDDITLNADLDASAVTGYVWLDTTQGLTSFGGGRDIIEGGGDLILGGADLLLTADDVDIETQGLTNLAGQFEDGGFSALNQGAASNVTITTVNGVSGVTERDNDNNADNISITNNVGDLIISDIVTNNHTSQVVELRASGLLQADAVVTGFRVRLRGGSFDLNTSITPRVDGGGEFAVRSFTATDSLGIGTNTTPDATVIFDNDSLQQIGNFEIYNLGESGDTTSSALDADLYVDVGAYTFSSGVILNSLGRGSDSIFINNDIILTGAGDEFLIETHPFFSGDVEFNNGANITTNNGDITFANNQNSTVFNANTTLNAGTGTITTGSRGTNANGHNLTLIADDIVLNGDVDGSGNLVLRPATNSTAINLNNGAGTGFELDLAELNRIGATTDFASLTIGGAAHTGALSLSDTGGTFTAESPLTLQAGSLTLSNALNVGANALTLTANAGDINQNATITTTGDLTASATGGTINVGADIDTNGGALSLNSTAVVTGANRLLNANGGALTVAALSTGAFDLSLQGASVNTNGAINAAGQTLNITATAGNIDCAGGTPCASSLITADTLNLDATGTIEADVDVATALDVGTNATGITLTGAFLGASPATQTEVNLTTFDAAMANSALHTFNGLEFGGSTAPTAPPTPAPGRGTVTPPTITPTPTPTPTPAPTPAPSLTPAPAPVTDNTVADIIAEVENINQQTTRSAEASAGSSLESGLFDTNSYNTTLTSGDFSYQNTATLGASVANNLPDNSATVVNNNGKTTVREGYQAKPGDVIITGGNSGIALSKEADTIVRLGANTRTSLRRPLFTGREETSDYWDVEEGIASFISGNTSHKGEIKTVTPEVAVRVNGTCYIVDRTRQTSENTVITLFGGEIEAYIKGQLVTLDAPVQSIELTPDVISGKADAAPVKTSYTEVMQRYAQHPEILPSSEDLAACGIAG